MFIGSGHRLYLLVLAIDYAYWFTGTGHRLRLLVLGPRGVLPDVYARLMKNDALRSLRVSPPHPPPPPHPLGQTWPRVRALKEGESSGHTGELGVVLLHGPEAVVKGEHLQQRNPLHTDPAWGSRVVTHTHSYLSLIHI